MCLSDLHLLCFAVPRATRECSERPLTGCSPGYGSRRAEGTPGSLSPTFARTYPACYNLLGERINLELRQELVKDGEMATPGGGASLVQHNGAPPAQTETETQFNPTHL